MYTITISRKRLKIKYQDKMINPSPSKWGRLVAIFSNKSFLPNVIYTNPLTHLYTKCIKALGVVWAGGGGC